LSKKKKKATEMWSVEERKKNSQPEDTGRKRGKKNLFFSLGGGEEAPTSTLLEGKGVTVRTTGNKTRDVAPWIKREEEGRKSVSHRTLMGGHMVDRKKEKGVGISFEEKAGKGKGRVGFVDIEKDETEGRKSGGGRGKTKAASQRLGEGAARARKKHFGISLRQRKRILPNGGKRSVGGKKREACRTSPHLSRRGEEGRRKNRATY